MEIALIAVVALFLYLRSQGAAASSAGTDPNAYGPPPPADSPYASGPNAPSGGSGDVGTWHGTPVPDKTAPGTWSGTWQNSPAPASATAWRGTPPPAPAPAAGTWRGNAVNPNLKTFSITAPTPPMAPIRTATAADFAPKALSPSAPFITTKPAPIAPPAPPPVVYKAAPPAPPPATYAVASTAKLQVLKPAPTPAPAPRAAATPIVMAKPGTTFRLR